MPINVTRLDADGDPVWTPEVVAIKTAATDTSRSAAARSSQGFVAWVWSDDTGGVGEGSILAQNVNADGSLGVVIGDDTIFANGFDD
jgi:hypothetical protein